MRGIARTLRISKNTVEAKFLWIHQYISSLKATNPVELGQLYFDELETIEHTKLKPLSVLLFVDEGYKILKSQVAVAPPKGRLAKVSYDKYGPRKDEREDILKQCFTELKGLRPKEIRSDAKPSYRKYVQEFFPGLSTRSLIAQRRSVTGTGFTKSIRSRPMIRCLYLISGVQSCVRISEG
ncbi:MAG: hypothetical protein IPM97_11690 [Bdellovibrionaceae bacterium]|nr:hypothetical protein [Pseudobdellovibrionaceae bacterium]